MRHGDTGVNRNSAAPGYSGYERRLIATLMLVSTVSYTDRTVFSVLSESIRRDLNFSDLEIGILGGFAFAIFYTLFGLPIAWLAERRSRVLIISVSTAVFSVMTTLCGVAGGFWQMLLFRVGVGAGEAGFLPPVTSMLGDQFRTGRRAGAMALVQLGSPLSAITGAILGAWIAGQWGWRAAFLILGPPGLIAAGLVLLLREPVRGASDTPSTEAIPSFWKAARTLLSDRAFVHVCVGGTLTIMVVSGVGQFFTPYLMRAFSLPVAQAGLAHGLTLSSSIAVGLVLGGFGMDRLGGRDVRWYSRGPAIALVVAVPLFWFGFFSHTLFGALPWLALACMTTFIFHAPTLAMIQAVTGPRTRATGAALFGVMSGLVGAGAGPTLVGGLSDLWAKLGDTDPGTSLRLSLCCTVSLLFLAAFHLWRASIAFGGKADE